MKLLTFSSSVSTGNSTIRVRSGRLRNSTSRRISSVAPELETATTRSSPVTMPTSPWMASAGWRKSAGVPVELISVGPGRDQTIARTDPFRPV